MAGTAIGFLILFENPDLGAWRWMYASTLLLAVPVIVGRFFIVQSPNWLAFRGRIKEAEEETERLLLREPRYPKEVILHCPQRRDHGPRPAKGQLVRAVQGNDAEPHDLASVPWFLQDLAPTASGFSPPPSWRH